MIAFVLGHWLAWTMLVAGLGLGRWWRPRQRTLTPPATWVAEIDSAQSAAKRFDYYKGDTYQPVASAHEVAVRIRKGNRRLTIGTAKVADDDFEQTVAALMRKAEDKAAAMNAVEIEAA